MWIAWSVGCGLEGGTTFSLDEAGDDPAGAPDTAGFASLPATP